MKTKIIVMIFGIIFINNTLTYGQNDSTNLSRTQISLYTSLLNSTNISDAHGNHGSSMGQPIDVTVEGIELKHNWSIGINTKFHIYNKFNLQLDLLYSNSIFPDQEVILDGFNIKQKKSDLNFFTISVGPGFRYSDDRIFRALNPYAFISFSLLLGFANDVSYMSAGRTSYSFVSGIGYNLQLGTQYNIDRFIISIEYRYEYLNSKVDYFRSFTEGLYFIKGSSSIFLGLGYAI